MRNKMQEGPIVKIAVLSTYPVSRPIHGGQRRVDAILRALGKAGHEVRPLPVFFGSNYPEHGAAEAPTALPGEDLQRIFAEGRREDLHMHELLHPGQPVFDALRDQLRAFAPDVVQFEHPWLFPLLDRMPELADVTVVYSSHNIEADLAPARFRDAVLAVEQAAARRADLIVAVSEADARSLSAWAAEGRGAPVVVAPNGCWPPALDPSVPRPVKEDYLLLVGSGHAPNAEGYWDVIGKVPGCIPPDARLVVAGDLGNLLRSDPRHRHYRMLNDHIVQLAGKVSDSALQALLTHARGILLPIKSGGGTNLKTAEALLSLKPVVAMRPAFRGFEEAMTLDGVHVAETEADFRSGVRALFAGDIAGTRRAEDVARYGWDATLSGLAAAYDGLAARL